MQQTAQSKKSFRIVIEHWYVDYTIRSKVEMPPALSMVIFTVSPRSIYLVRFPCIREEWSVAHTRAVDGLLIEVAAAEIDTRQGTSDCPRADEDSDTGKVSEKPYVTSAVLTVLQCRDLCTQGLPRVRARCVCLFH